jgi:hypothetical protein
VRRDLLDQRRLERLHPRHVDLVEVAVGGRPDDRDLLGEPDRLVLGLLEHLDQPVAPVELRLRRLVQVGAERRERLQLAELREVEPERAGDLLHRLGLRVAADPGDRDADVDGRPDALVEEVGLQEDLAVGDRDDVGRDVRRDVATAGLDQRQRRERAAAELVGELRGALQQAGVQVEDVARVGLATRGPAEQQRERPVGNACFDRSS